MVPTDIIPAEALWEEDAFRFIKPNEFKNFGIDPADIPLGTYAALKQPSQIRGRFGGNAYGFGLFEVYDRLAPKDIALLQTITPDNPEDIKQHHKELNEIYKKIGLLIRFSSLGKPYYMIPAHLVSRTITQIKCKVDEIAKVVGFHRKKYFIEHHAIGLLTHPDDLIIQELSFRFKEHRFVVLNSIDKLTDLNQTLDLVILARDPYETLLMEKFSPLSQEKISKKRLEQYAVFILWKLYNCLKPNGEIFVIANHYPPKTTRTAELIFKTNQEEKAFSLFTHVFKTRAQHGPKDHTLRVNIFDFQKYLSGVYVEQEVIQKLLGGKKLENMTLKDMEKLPYMDFRLTDEAFLRGQEKTWANLFSCFFDKILLKPLVPEFVKEDWDKRFSMPEYKPRYMLIYLGQKKTPNTTTAKVMDEVTGSGLAGSSVRYLADYRDSFEHVIRTLQILRKLKESEYETIPRLYVDRLKQPLENKARRYPALNHVLKLIAKINRLEEIKAFLNPDRLEGLRAKVLENLEFLAFFGFRHNELKEIAYIVLGHTPMGRIISGKMNEKALKPMTDLARTLHPHLALNLFRYILLMTLAETEAAGATEGTPEQLTELIDLYESIIRIVTNRELDWDKLLDEKTDAVGGTHSRIVRKLIMMINHFEFLDNWNELKRKGSMEKESLADYDDKKLSRIENVIRLVSTLEQFEGMYLRFDPLQLPAFFRKFLNIEFHGTGHLFENMDSRHVFILLWIAVNLVRGEVVNFNPILANAEPSEIDDLLKKVELETSAINIYSLDLNILRQFSEQLHQIGTAFILGTGFQLRVEAKTQNLEIAYLNIGKNISELECLSERIAGHPISHIAIDDLKALEFLFSNLESFYQSHLRLIRQDDATPKLPDKQKRWFEKIEALRENLKSNFLGVIFQPESLYTDLDRLYRYTPSLLDFVLPEFTRLQNLDLSWHLYLQQSITLYIINSTRKFQALVCHDRENFQDIHLLHTLAQREFGPMAAGIIGVSKSQIEMLEAVVERLGRNRPLLDALVKSFIFQDLGRLPALREKHRRDIDSASYARASAIFLEKENIAEKFKLAAEEKAYLIFLVRHHSLLHHIIRGEFSFCAIRSVLNTKNQDLFDAFFVLSFIMLSAIREDLMLEDLADRLFEIRRLCLGVLDGETTLESELNEIFVQSGHLFFALEDYQREGLPEGMTPSEYLESRTWRKIDPSVSIRTGKMVFATERLFRLRGIRYVQFRDLVKLLLKVPLKYIYKKRGFSSIGYSTFEREMYEALRIYNTLQNLPKAMRHFILNRLVDDKVRIFGYEKVAGYLSYENQIKLLLIGLWGTKGFRSGTQPIRISFLEVSAIIEKRYEAMNDFLNGISLEELSDSTVKTLSLFKAKSGVVLRKESASNLLSVKFHDRLNISQKISYMNTIDNAEQLKNYFHYGLRSLRKHPFHTEDYELELEKAFETRLGEITDMMLDQAKRRMNLIKDFEELDNLLNDLLERAWDIGFSVEQKHRLNDLYELRKDNLKRKKLSEIESVLKSITDTQELQAYWDSLKWYLKSNRQFFGKEFENLIAGKFDRLKSEIEGV